MKKLWAILRSSLIGIGALGTAGAVVAIANYTMTQGAGITFGSIVVSMVNYPQMLICDLTTPSQCSAVNSAGSQQVAGQGTAGSPAGGVVSIQGVGSGTAVPVSGTVTANAGTNLNTSALALETGGNLATVAGAVTSSVMQSNTKQVNGVTVLTGTGATGTGAQRVTVSTDQATNAGAALVKGGVGVVNGGSFYEAVAASQTGTVLQSSTGATGDYLSHCVIYPTSTSPGVVTVFDNTNAAANNVIAFPGGTTSTSNLAPIAVPVGAVSVNGAWKVTTGANVSVVCYGKFS